jgi:phospholipid/cholesterol/gamma-HCH transport system substrate-binding protein
MKRKPNEFYIGLSVIITVLVVIAVIFYLESHNFLSGGITVNMVVEDAAGISSGADIYYKGLKVGSVGDTRVASKGILLELQITKLDSIPDDSRFTISSSSIIGGKSVQIRPGNSDTYLKDGSTVKGAAGESLSDVINTADSTARTIKKAVGNIDTLTDEDTQRKVNKILSGVEESVSLINQTLKSSLDDINRSVANIREITSENKAPIDTIVQRLSIYATKINTSINNIEKATGHLKAAAAGLNSGKGTAGKLLTDDELYNRINKTIENLNSLINDIKEHPAKYVHVSLF